MRQSPERNRLKVVGEQEATFGFVLIFGQFRAAHKLAGVFPVGFTGDKERSPVLVELAQNVIGDFAGQGTVGVVVFDEMENSCVPQVAVLKDEGLPHEIIGGIVEVLGLKRRRINGSKAGVSLGDDVLLDQLHRYPQEKLRMRPTLEKSEFVLPQQS